MESVYLFRRSFYAFATVVDSMKELDCSIRKSLNAISKHANTVASLDEHILF